MNGDGNNLDPTAVLYNQTTVINSSIGRKSTVGDFSKVENCVLGDYVRIDRNNYVWESTIGNHCNTGKNTTIIKVQMGNFVTISWNISIGGANHDYSRMTVHNFVYNDFDELKPKNGIGYDRFTDQLTIGNDVWIAANTVITRGVTIGNGAVIGAGAVVTKDVPEYAVVAGVPAKVIKYRFDEKEIALLNQIQWWNWDDQKIRDNYDLLSSKVTTEQLEKFLADNHA